ncbi:sugar transferase [Rhodococcus sp. G-MC3]|nr:sugar transferase [Rhodococcus sp. G-MC3]MDJ0396354.1 sugar transferase [Rhodococcus sp. G-MC3]
MAASTLLVLAPVLLGCWTCVKVQSPRRRAVRALPRMGFRGRQFGLLNFRAPGPDCDDSHMTRHGLVHLPELLNVMRGDMSLVGPRPRPVKAPRSDRSASSRSSTGHRPTGVDLRPGMTGLWMLMDRTELTPDDLATLDHEYVASWSLARDIRILRLTAARVRYRRKPN